MVTRDNYFLMRLDATIHVLALMSFSTWMDAGMATLKGGRREEKQNVPLQRTANVGALTDSNSAHLENVENGPLKVRRSSRTLSMSSSRSAILSSPLLR